MTEGLIEDDKKFPATADLDHLQLEERSQTPAQAAAEGKGEREGISKSAHCYGLYDAHL
ncbi:hypothetical protein ACLK19_25425 [Escherichia coli]